MILFILFIVLATSIFVNLPLYTITRTNFTKKNAKKPIYEIFENLKKNCRDLNWPVSRIKWPSEGLCRALITYEN